MPRQPEACHEPRDRVTGIHCIFPELVVPRLPARPIPPPAKPRLNDEPFTRGEMSRVHLVLIQPGIVLRNAIPGMALPVSILADHLLPPLSPCIRTPWYLPIFQQ